MGAVRSTPMTAMPPFDENNPERRHCPKCGKLLLNHSSRTELDGEGNPEPVYMFMCHTHGFFAFRPSTGLTNGF